MSNTITGSLSTTCMLEDDCIALCRGVPSLPIFPSWSIEPEQPVRNFETNTEWIINYRSLIARFEKRRKGSLFPSAELHAICADRITAMISYLQKLESCEDERCWSESRPYLLSSSRQDREMGRSAKYYLFTDAQKIWTLDTLLQEEEAENLLCERDDAKEDVLTHWRNTIIKMGTRFSKELRRSFTSSALLREFPTHGSDSLARTSNADWAISATLRLPAYGDWRYSVRCMPDGQVDLDNTLRQIQSIEEVVLNRYMETRHIWKTSQSAGRTG